MERLATALLDGLRETAAMVLDPSERIYWGFLVSALVIAWLVQHVDRRGVVPRTPGSALHRSSWLDVQLLVFNTVLRTVGAIAFTLSAFGLAIWLVGRMDAWLGAPRFVGVPAPVVALVYTVVLFVAWDGSRYLLHKWMHDVPWLWELHKVHHSAEVLTPLTLYRTHPIESLLFGLRGVLVTGVVTSLFFWAFRRNAVELELLGVNVLGFVFNLVGANLRHSHVWWPWGRLERWLMSPAQHQMHHAVDATSSVNLGTWLSLWDRRAGTLRFAGERPPSAFGLAAAEANHHPHRLGSALVRPLVAALARLYAGRRRIVGPLVVALLGSLVGTAQASAAAPAAPLEPGAPAPVEPAAPLEPTPLEPTPLEPTPPPVAAPDATAPPAMPPASPTPSPPAEPPAPRTPAKRIEPPRWIPASWQRTTTPSDDDDDDGIHRKVVVGSMFDGDELPRVAGSAHVIGKRELEKHEYDDVHRVLSTVPGVYVRGEDGFGLRPNIGLRGANPDRSAKVTLMEDGILLGPAPYSAPAAYYFPLPTRMVGVEVFKGPAAIRFGPNTIGGAINFRTRDIPQDNEMVIDVAGGRFGYAKGHGYWGMTHKGFGVLLEAAHLQSQGFKKLDGGGNTGFRKNEAMIKLGYEARAGPDTRHRVQLKGGFANETSNETYLGLTRADFEDTPYRRYAASQRDRMTWWRSQAELDYTVGNPTLELATRLYRHDFHRVWRRLDHFRDGPDLSNVLRNPDAGQLAVLAAVLRGEEDATGPEQALVITNNDRRFVSQGAQSVLRWRPEWRRVTQDLEIGMRVHNDSIERNHVENAYMMTSGELLSDGSDPVVATRNRGATTAAAFHVHDAVTVLDRLTLAGGMRLEMISMHYRDRLTGVEARRFDTAVSPGIGALVQALPWLGVFAGLHRGFSPVAPGQPESVKPELSLNYEAGIRATRQGLWAEAVGFFSDYSNLNGVCTFSAGCSDGDGMQQFNGGRVWVYGLESLVRYKHRFRNGFGVEVGAQYTYTGSQFRRTFASEFTQWGDVEAGDQLPYVPQHLVGGSIGVGGRIWDVSLRPSYSGAMRDVAGQGSIPDDEKIPGFFVMDASAEVRVLRRLVLYAQLTNTTGNAYIASMRPYGIRPGAPLVFVFGLKVHVFP